MNRALYEGTIEHRRYGQTAHAFTYSIFMVYLELSRIEELLEPLPLWSARHPAPAWFRRRDHFGEEPSLEASVREAVRTSTGEAPGGPIRVLTHLRYWGICFNPISLYYCFDGTDTELHSVVVEVHNTPWLERHPYVMDVRDARREEQDLVFRFDKDFHVSPFLPMDLGYRMRLTPPGERLEVDLDVVRQGSPVLDAELELDRTPLEPDSAPGILARYPLMSLKVIAGIYYESLKLWWKGASFHPHPKHRTSPGES